MSCVYSKVTGASRFLEEPLSAEEISAFDEVVNSLEKIPVGN